MSFIKPLVKYENQKLVGHQESTNIWDHTIHLKNSWNMTKILVRLQNGMFKPYNKVDGIAAYHEICYDMGKNKAGCDNKVIKLLDEIPYGEMSKWGQTARFLVNSKQKLGLGVPKNGKNRRVTGNEN